MAKLPNWLISAAGKAFDPKRGERLAQQAAGVWELVKHQKNQFSYDYASAVWHGRPARVRHDAVHGLLIRPSF